MNQDPTLTPPDIKDKVPWTIVLLLTSLVIFTTGQLYKLAQVLINWQTLAGLGLEISPIYLALAGLAWGLIGSFSIWGIWARKYWSPLSCTLIAILYGVLFWIDRFFISQPEVFSRRWPVNLAFTILGLGALTIILNLKSTRIYFGKNTVKIP